MLVFAYFEKTEKTFVQKSNLLPEPEKSIEIPYLHDEPSGQEGGRFRKAEIHHDSFVASFMDPAGGSEPAIK